MQHLLIHFLMLCFLCGVIQSSQAMTDKHVEQAGNELNMAYRSLGVEDVEGLASIQELIACLPKIFKSPKTKPGKAARNADKLAWQIIQSYLPELSVNTTDLKPLSALILKECTPDKCTSINGFKCAILKALTAWCSGLTTKSALARSTHQRKKSTNTPVEIATNQADEKKQDQQGDQDDWDLMLNLCTAMDDSPGRSFNSASDNSDDEYYDYDDRSIAQTNHASSSSSPIVSDDNISQNPMSPKNYSHSKYSRNKHHKAKSASISK